MITIGGLYELTSRSFSDLNLLPSLQLSERWTHGRTHGPIEVESGEKRQRWKDVDEWYDELGKVTENARRKGTKSKGEHDMLT